MGKIGDDPYCPCVMKRMGLPSSDIWTEEQIKQFEKMFEDDIHEGE